MKFLRAESTEALRRDISSIYNEEVADIVVDRMESATVSDWLSVDVETLRHEHHRITVWSTDVDSDSQFYDEWYSADYSIEYKGESHRFEVDIR